MPQRQEDTLLELIEEQLANNDRQAALLHLALAAQKVSSRQRAQQLWQLWQKLPKSSTSASDYSDWQRAGIWLAFRAWHYAELRTLLVGVSEGPLCAFWCCLLADEGAWLELLSWADLTPSNCYEWHVALRFKARAYAELQYTDWQSNYDKSLDVMQKRDKGLSLLDYAHYLAKYGFEIRAREVYAEAAALLNSDFNFQVFAYANWGISCIKSGDIEAARKPIKTAVTIIENKYPKKFFKSKQGQVFLQIAGEMTVSYRALGYYYFRQGCWPQAKYAFERALLMADHKHDRHEAIKGLLWSYRVAKQWDDGLAFYHIEAYEDAQVSENPWLLLEMAFLQLGLGNFRDCEKYLCRAENIARSRANMSHSLSWQLTVARVEISRLRKQDYALPIDEVTSTAQYAAAWSLPELFPTIRPPRATWQLNVAGPVSLSVSGHNLQIDSGKKSAVLIAMLCHHGSVSQDQALDGLGIEGASQRAKTKKLSNIVQQVRQIMDWPEALEQQGKVYRWSDNLHWEPVIWPSASEADKLCQGHYCPWVNERISELTRLNSVEPSNNL